MASKMKNPVRKILDSDLKGIKSSGAFTRESGTGAFQGRGSSVFSADDDYSVKERKALDSGANEESKTAPITAV